MEISFHTKIGLEFAIIVFGVLSIVYSYLGVIIGAIGAILLYHEINTHSAEKADFREKIIREALDNLDIVPDPNSNHIPHEKWDSKVEKSKPDLLGINECKLWKEFYDSIDARNRHFRLKNGLGAWEDFVKVNDQCVRSFLRVYDSISWVRESEEAKARITAFFQKAKGTASISKNLRSV